MAYENSLIDKRVVDRNIAKGLVDPQVYKQVIESLPDSEANCVRVSLDGDHGAAEAQGGEQVEQAGVPQPAPGGPEQL
jgi:hypothetical protein